MGAFESAAGAAGPRGELAAERGGGGSAPSPSAGGEAGVPPPRLPRLPVPARPPSLPFPFAAMAATAEQEQQQFYLLLGNLLSPDNAVRKQAEVTGPPRPGPGRQAGLSDLADLAGGRRRRSGGGQGGGGAG